MRIRKWKSLVSIGMAAVLAMSTAAYADTIITPLEESSVSSMQSGNSAGSGGPSGSSGNTGNGPVAGNGNSGNTGNTGSGPSAGSGNDGSTGSTGNGPSAGNGNTGSVGSTGSTGNGPGTSEGNTGTTSSTLTTTQIPQPTIASEGAVLMDGATGTVLFSKNGDTQFYPASITKLMTALLVAENCSLDEVVTFSATATTNLESGAVSINMTEGDTMTVRQCLYALLLKSANEVGNALAEHVAGSNAAFADMMNARAAALGCTGTHFTNPHGLNDSNHYTTPHDMALIAREAFKNETVKTVAFTRTYTLPATKKNPSGLTVTMGHKMLNPGDSRYYPGVIGGKTGYTSKAGNTLVTAAEQDGVRLIAVVMKSKSTHYVDTKALFDYGFALAKAGGLSGSTSTGTQNNGPGTSAQKGWLQDSTGWTYIKDNGAKAANEWVTVDGLSYWFDASSYMAKGWRNLNGTWYYLRSDGSMAKNYWCQVPENGKWFYLGSNGAMLTNTTTPDGYTVGSDGAWIQ